MSTQTTEETRAFRLSPQQRHLWRLQEGLGPRSDTAPQAKHFSATVAVLLEGGIEAGALRAAVEDVVARYEIFHTLLRKLPGMKVPVQQPAPALAPVWRQLPTMPAPAEGSLAAAVSSVREQLDVHWDLLEGPLVLSAWRPFEGGGGLLLLELPALLTDIAGLDLLVREITIACAARSSGEELGVPELQYSDIAEWQLELLENEETDEGRVYWSQKRLHRLRCPSLPFIAAGPTRERPAGIESVPVPFPETVSLALVKKAKELGAPPSALLLAAWQSLLYRYDPQAEFLLGVVFDGRSYEGLEDTPGLFSRSIPLVSAIDGSTPFSAVVERVATGVEEIHEWQEFFDWDELAKQREGQSEPSLPIGFEFAAKPEVIETSGVRWQVVHQQANTDAFTLQLCGSLDEGGIQGSIFFDPRVMARGDGERLAEQLAVLCAAATENAETPVARLPVMGLGRRQEALGALHGEARYAPVKCIHHLFEEQAAVSPEAIAVQDGSTAISFGELRQRSLSIAHHLHHRGVGPEVRVAVATERSCEMVAALMGVLQAGGAYVPLDPALPKERLAQMLEDSATSLLLTQEVLRPQLPAVAGLMTLEEIATAPAETTLQAPESGVGLDHLAYVLFTSGSTGRPKGVAVAHRQIVHYAQNVAVNLRLPPRATFAMASSFAADLGNTAIFPPLIRGGTVRILTTDEVTDPAAFRRAMEGGTVDCLKIVPSHLRALLAGDEPEVSLPRQRLIIGGEAASAEWVDSLLAWMPEGEVFNHYGPTETTVGVLAGPLAAAADERHCGILSLGRPIGDTRIYVVDRNLEPVPPWMPGELLIGGANVARGYLGRPALTAERFIPDPFTDSPGSRLYRTGDLVRMRPGGELEFLGRTDSQVKLRGFRVELGEVEANLRQIPGVRDAVAGIHEQEGGGPRLVAWIVEESDAELSDKNLRAALLQKVPEVMVPAVFTRLMVMPLNANGKLDRRALPQPREHSTVEYIPPRTAEEKILAEIWTALLPVSRVGIQDNFFLLGGDSILSIQVIARANQAGVYLRPNQIFDHQTIAELAQVARVAAEVDAEQGPVTGPAPLTPIQRRFFEQEHAEPHHFNQSVLLSAPPDLQPDALEAAWVALLKHHDALRLRFYRKDGRWQQEGAAADDCILLQRIDLSDLQGEALETAWMEAAEELEACLDLRQGPLVRIGWGYRGNVEPGRLLLVVHHLVVDGVSWRILLEDLESAYHQLTAGTAEMGNRAEVTLPSKTTSFQRWAEKLEEYAGSEALHCETGYWTRTLAGAPELPVDLEDGDNDEGSTGTASVALSAEVTAALLKDVHGTYNTRINDFLLTGLVQAITPWLGTGELLLDLEGHGREDALFEAVDLSRTVGWFTAVHPLRLQLGDPSSPGDSLRQVKEQLRAIPRNGIGFGVLRFLNGPVAEKLQALGKPEVVFNYLGQFDQVAPSDGNFGPGEGAIGAQRSPRGQRPYLFEIIALVKDSQLRIEWIYSRNRHRPETVELLASRFRSALETLVEHCRTPGAGGFTPSDFPLTSLTQQQLDRVAGRDRQALEDLYPLSPMQRSLYLFGMQHPRSGVGVEQMSFTLRGDLVPEAFWNGWQAVVDRHPILRTRFISEGASEPLQWVERCTTLPRQQEDWRHLSPEAQEEGRQRFLEEDLRRGFDFGTAPMMRIALLREADDRWRFIFTRHHAILDGWSSVLLLQEGFANYETSINGGNLEQLPAEPYRHYIEWLQSQDLSQAEAFWRGRLEGFTHPTELNLPAPEGVAPTGAGREVRTLSRNATSALETLARRHVVTLNTVIQSAWALLLSRYSGRSHVLFGHTVSGRPPALGKMESMTGLFINNLPVPVRVQEEATFESWLKGLQRQQVEVTNFDFAPLERVQEWSEIPPAHRFFDTLVVFENYPIGGDGNIGDDEPALVMENFEAPVKTGYQLTLVAVPGGELTLALTYDRQRVAVDAVQRVLEDLASLLEGFPGKTDESLATHLQRITQPPAPAAKAESTGGERPPLVEPRNPLEMAVAEIFAELFGIQTVGVHDDFFALGGSSFLALSLVRRIHERTGQEVPLPALVGGTTVEDLAETLRRQSAAAGRSLVPLQPKGEKPPLFLVHSAGGMIVNLLELARVTDRNRPLFALQDPRLAGGEKGSPRSVEDLAAAYLEEIRGLQQEGPYHLGGHSFGGVVAFEIARRLEEEGQTVASLLLFDSTAPSAARELPDDAAVLAHISAMFARFYDSSDPATEEELRALPEEQRISRVLETLDEGPADTEHFTRFFHLYKEHMSALRTYAPSAYCGPITLFRAEDRGERDFHRQIDDAATLGWSNHTGDGKVRMINLSGNHTTILRSPHVQRLAEAVAAATDSRPPVGGTEENYNG